MPIFNSISPEDVAKINQRIDEEDRVEGERGRRAYYRNHLDQLWKDPSERDFSGRIFCMMGKSASGKDTVYSKVLSRLAKDGMDISKIITYTTRPQRLHEEDGDEYFFISKSTLDARLDAGEVIEQRDYDTEYGVWSYATLDDGQIQGNRDYLVIGTPDVYDSFVSYFGDDHVIPILIVIDDGTRLMRALTREMQQEMPKYDEMCRRYLSDKRDFAAIDEDSSVTRFTNRDADECAAEIMRFVKTFK